VTLHAILTELRNRGVELIPEGKAIRYRAPRGVFTPELRQAVASKKTELLALLSPSPPNPEVCEHITDPELEEWYRENPHMTCARCWLAGHPLRWVLQ